MKVNDFTILSSHTRCMHAFIDSMLLTPTSDPLIEITELTTHKKHGMFDCQTYHYNRHVYLGFRFRQRPDLYYQDTHLLFRKDGMLYALCETRLSSTFDEYDRN